MMIVDLLTTQIVAAPAPLAVNSAVFNKKTNVLTVKTTTRGNLTGNLVLLHGEGGLLTQQTISKPKQSFAVPLAQLGQVPCTVKVQAARYQASKAVQGAPSDCSKIPVCKILVPKSTTAPYLVKAGEVVNFEGKAILKDKKAGPLTIQWDFAGGTMDHPGNSKTGTTFVRDNSFYKVRFTALDARKRYCEAALDVQVGQPPPGTPLKVAEQPAPQRGQETAGTKGDVVVIPFEEWTYQNSSDMRKIPNGYSSFSPVVNNIRAYAFRKDRLPVFLADNEIDLYYSAASNTLDPVGADSINSTSQNWPVNTSLMNAAIQKTDMWELPQRPKDQQAPNYFACSWAMTGYWGAYGCGDALGFPTIDEGYFKAKKDAAGNIIPDDPNNLQHGLLMPGKDKPYFDNTPQAFSKFVSAQKRLVPGGKDQPAAWFAANLLPITDIDDKGRVNSYPMLRVEAKQKGSSTVLAKTDGVVSTGKDFHCRECHAKGKVAANPATPFAKGAFASSAFGKVALVIGQKQGAKHRYFIAEENKPARPELFSVEDIGGDPNNIMDQEYAAALNYSSVHQFYDVIPFLNEMKYGIGKIYLTDAEKNHPTNVDKDTPRPCYGCHTTPLNAMPFGVNSLYDEEGWEVNDPAYAPNYSISMHRFHGELQWKDDAKTDIVRDEKGAFKRWDWKTSGPNNSTATRSLFPIFDAQGKQLPMEENCLKCHSGHREQLYRDRMYTAGVTCFDCHGDMLAMGEAFPKNFPANKTKLGSIERDDYRVPWFDEPDCGSCHVGNANKGKDKNHGFYSAGVMKTAFNADDWSATTRPIDRQNADSARFAVAPLENYKAVFPTTYAYGWDEANLSFLEKQVDTKVDAPLFREGKDRHGNVACAACHGAAHSIWPNRNPAANDNVTALQLQGHTGTILECNVCHSADSFANFADLDGGANYSGDAKPGILGGPHNMHPVNDPYWWRQANGDTVDSTPDSPKQKDGIIKGGWHNDYAKIPGKNGEDQCAACHGNDHKGTRLARTPVDREFINEKGKKISVKAGTEISCSICHSLEKSFTGSPARG